MKLVSLLCIFSLALSIEIRYDQQPIGYVLRDRGQIANITRYINFDFELNIKNLLNQTVVMNENIDNLLEICNNLQPKIDCDLLAIFLRNKVSDIDVKNSFRNKRGCFCDFFRELFGLKTTNDQEIIDQLQNDIRLNRNLMTNETILLNKTVSLQNEINTKIFDEISLLKNVSKRNELNTKFVSITQSILMALNDDEDIADAIIGLIKSPDYTHVLKLIGFQKINNQLCEAQKSLSKNETIASGTYESLKRTLTLSRIETTKNNENMTIKIIAPIISGSWNVTEMVPISFKGERGMRKLKLRNRFVVHGYKDSYAFLNFKLWNSCKKYENVTICRFKFSRQKSCASNLYFKQKYIRCQFGHGVMPNIIQVNKTHIFANVNSESTFAVQCDGPKHAFKIIKSAWIKVEQGCHLESNLKKDQSIINWPKIRLNVTIIPINASRWKFNVPNDIDVISGNSSLPSLQQLYPEINMTYLDTKKPVERITANSSILTLLVQIAIGFASFIVFVVIVKCSLKYLIQK